MTPKLQNDIALWCHAAAIGFLQTYSEKTNQGPEFKWNNFPDMVAKYCETMVFVYVAYHKKHKYEVDEHASKTGREIAEKLVKCVHNLQS